MLFLSPPPPPPRALAKRLSVPALLLTLMSAFLPGHASAQTPVNADLRSVFGPLTPPNPGPLFLYDMVLHTTDDAYYVPLCYDTNNADNWWDMYDEMQQSAYNLSLLQPDSILMPTGPELSSQDVRIGIMDYQYNRFRADAFDSLGEYFFWTDDTVMDMTTRATSPYETGNVFAVSPAIKTLVWKQTRWHLDPAMLFTDIAGSPYYTTANNFRIDFDDGTGWHYFNLSSAIVYAASYKTGMHQLRAELVDQAQRVIKHSESAFEAKGMEFTARTGFETVGSEEVSVWAPCTDATFKRKKIVIYVEGIDPLNDRTAAIIYSDMVRQRNPGLEDLRNYGYEFWVVDWTNSVQSMRINAMNLVRIIDQAKQRMHTANGDDKEQLVVIGESMGGVVARYALSFMETPGYQSLEGTFAKENLHNCRLFISLDAPQQGAFIPPSLQLAYKDLHAAVNSVPFLGQLIGARPNSNAMQALLTSPAATQLLIQHVDNINGAGNIGPHPNRTAFMADLTGMANGGYPRFCKLMALANGNASGVLQTRFAEDANSGVRTPGDRYLEAHMDYTVKFLRFMTVHVGELQYKLMSNPTSSGMVYDMNYKIGTVHFKGFMRKWFKKHPQITIVQMGHQVFLNSPTPIDIDRMPGSFVRNFKFSEEIGASEANLLFGFMRYNLTATANVVSFSSRFGLVNRKIVTATLATDGFAFNFIPLWSALDYTPPAGTPLNTDIASLPASVNLSRTPFDVIVAWHNNPNSAFVDGKTSFNRNHLNMRSDFLPGVLHSTGFANMLNREIGDDELYLDNVTMNRDASYSAPFSLTMGLQQNPYYTYPSTTLANSHFMCLSKENPFIAVNTAGGSLAAIDLTTAQGQAPPPTYTPGQVLPSGFAPALLQAPWAMCFNQSYNDRKPAPASANAASQFILYPNPAMLDLYAFVQLNGQAQTATFTLTDLTGRELKTMQVPCNPSGANSINLSEFTQAAPGIYLVRLQTGNTTLTQKLIVQ